MYRTELFFVEAQSELGATLDTTELVRGSAVIAQNGGMLPIGPEDFAEHKLGLFAVASEEAGAPALGYVACKEFIEKDVILGGATNAQVRPAIFAHIGGLYVTEAARNRGIAHQLVRRMTNLTFSTFGEVTACAANCNRASIGKFMQVGYSPVEGYGQVLPESAGKVELHISRDIWTWRQQASDCTIGADHA